MDKTRIRTWRERIGVAENFPLHLASSVERAMVAEIVELRALQGVGQGGDMVAVKSADLMTLARQIIAEQMDDCDEEFMAGRAHGVGSFHSEILELSKRTAMAQAKNENETILALHRQLAGERLRADQGWERAEAKSRECIQLRERLAATSAGGR